MCRWSMSKHPSPSLRPIRPRHSIPAVLDGSDVLVTAQTGSADLGLQ